MAVDAAILDRFLELAVDRLDGDWVVIGGMVLPLVGITHRVTMDIDVAGPEGNRQMLELLQLAVEVDGENELFVYRVDLDRTLAVKSHRGTRFPLTNPMFARAFDAVAGAGGEVVAAVPFGGGAFGVLRSSASALCMNRICRPAICNVTLGCSDRIQPPTSPCRDILATYASSARAPAVASTTAGRSCSRQRRNLDRTCTATSSPATRRASGRSPLSATSSRTG